MLLGKTERSHIGSKYFLLIGELVMSEYKNIIKREFHFVGIGSAKSGTTALWYYLMQHPDLYSGPVLNGRTKWLGIDRDNVPWVGLEIKEPNFFNTPVEHYNLKKYAEWIEKMNSAPEDKLLGEFTVHYINSLDALKAIKEHSPNAKILAILRNPIDRCYSHFNWHYAKDPNCNQQQFYDMINNPHMLKHFGDKSKYFNKLMNCFEVFPKEQLMFIKYEDFKKDNEKIVMDTLRYLNLDVSKYTFVKRMLLLSEWKYPMIDQVKNAIKEYVLHDIEKIEELLGWDCSDWRE